MPISMTYKMIMEKYHKIDTPEILDALFVLPLESISECPEHAEDIAFLMADKTILSCRLYLAEKDGPTLLYFHGGREFTNQYDKIAESYLKSGLNLLLVAYRGYGKSGGTPGIVSLMADSQTLAQKTSEFLKEKDCNGPLFVMGKSIGSACAIEIAYKFPDSIKGLIIDSGFCDTISFFSALGIDTGKLGFTEDDGFNNLQKIEEIKIPTLILHGSKDALVPPAVAETLQASSGARSKQFHIVPGAEHGEVAESGGELYYQTIKSFVDTVSGINTWRQRRGRRRKLVKQE